MFKLLKPGLFLGMFQLLGVGGGIIKKDISGPDFMVKKKTGRRKEDDPP